jgi:hypothetical protein
MTRPFAVVALGILVAACGGSKTTAKPGLGDGGETYTATTTTQQFIDQLVSAECDFMVRCSYLPDKSTCLAYVDRLSSPGTNSLAYAIDQGRMTLNQSNLPACIAAFSNLSCTLGSSNSSTLNTPCDAAAVGTIASGGDCVFDGECKPGLECDKGSCTASCCPGVCVATKPLAAVGGSCTSDSNCVDTAYCKLSYNSTTGSFDGICLARVATGAVCTDYGSCPGNAQCVGTTGSKTCVALAKDGASCANGLSCENSTSYCDQVKGTCQPRIKDNAPCTLPDAGASAALASGCFNYSECKNGVCRHLPLADEACSNPDAAAINECLLVGKCVGGFCQADPPKPLCTVAAAKAAVADAGVRD